MILAAAPRASMGSIIKVDEKGRRKPKTIPKLKSDKNSQKPSLKWSTHSVRKLSKSKATDKKPYYFI